jgi:energy-coupling factor transporter ATP-binding protein EcfA2
MLDEPNANLDHEGDEALVRTLQVLKGERVTVVIVWRTALDYLLAPVTSYLRRDGRAGVMRLFFVHQTM